MPFSRSKKEPDLERILDSGEPSGAEDAELAAFTHALRAAYRARPQEATAARHMAEIRAAAATLPAAGPQSVASAKQAPPARRLALVLAATALTLPILATGLAFAGVALPGPADSAFQQVGIELPNQDESATETPPDSGDDPPGATDNPGNQGEGSDVSKERRNGARGLEASRYGRCVSRAASAGVAHPNRECAHLKKNAGKKNGGGKNSNPGRPDSPGKSGGAPGQADKPDQGKGNSQGNGNANGQAKGKDKAQGNANSNNGNANGKTKSKDKAQSNDKGKSKSSEKSNGKSER